MPLPDRYSRLSIAMHWVMLILLVTVAATMELRGVVPKSDPLRDVLRTWHYMLGPPVFGW